MGLADEAEIGAAYINVQEAVLIRTLLLKLGHTVFLDTQSHKTRSVPHLLVAGHHQPWQLVYA